MSPEEGKQIDKGNCEKSVVGGRSGMRERQCPIGHTEVEKTEYLGENRMFHISFIRDIAEGGKDVDESVVVVDRKEGKCR
jgi:hypothetical protein